MVIGAAGVGKTTVGTKLAEMKCPFLREGLAAPPQRTERHVSCGWSGQGSLPLESRDVSSSRRRVVSGRLSPGLP